VILYDDASIVVLLTLLGGIVRDLSFTESSQVSGGEEQKTNYDEFWTAYFQGAGWGAGYLSSIPIAVCMAAYAIVYYGVYTPIAYVASGAYSATSYVAGGVYSGASSAVNSITK